MSGSLDGGAVGVVARRAWRTSWRAHMALALTAALAVAFVLAVIAGAQRSHSALSRLRAESHAADLLVGEGDPDVDDLQATVAATDGVIASGVVRELFVRPVGSELFPSYQLLSLVSPPPSAAGPIDTAVVITGRPPDPDVVAEVALSESFAADLGVQVGETIALESMSFDWVEQSFDAKDPGPPDGPVVEVEVVGLARTPADFGRWPSMIHLTPAFADRYASEIRTYTFVEARLTDALGDRVRANDRVELPGLDGAEIGPSYFAGDDATQDGLGTISTALYLVAAASALAGLTAVALTSLRLARQTLEDRDALVAIGWTRPEMARLVTTVLGPWLLVGVVIGTAGGVLASPLASVGLARAVDPAGDSVVLPAGTLATVAVVSALLVAGVVVASAVRASRARDPHTTGEWALPPVRRPLAVALGVRRALFGAPSRGGRASRGAAAAATVAVAVAVGALLVGSSIQRLQDDPFLSGQGPTSQRGFGGEDLEVYEAAMAVLDDDLRAADLMGVHVAFGVTAPGVDETTALILDVRRGEVGASILRGRLPSQPDEVAVGPATLKDMGLAVGDDVELSDEGSAKFHIVGEVLFPQGDFEHDSGVAMTLDGFEPLGGVEVSQIHSVALSWGSGVDVAAADASLLDMGIQVYSTNEGLVPPIVSNLGEVKRLPVLLAGLVLTLALVTALHGVSLTTRLRQREAGTLRALGMTPRVIAAIVEVHGAAVALVALALGVPFGLAAGRQVWTLIAERAHVVDRPVPAWAGMGWVAAAVVIGTLLLALPPAVRSLRQRPAAALRAE